MKYLIKVVIFLCPLVGIAIMAQGTVTHPIAQKPAPKSQILAPDLNLLRSRVEAFWKLRQQGRKQEALNYVDPSCRKNFMSRNEPKFLSFSLVGMDFSPDSSSVAVKVAAQILFPRFPAPVDFPVEETYVFRNGNWYAQVAPPVDPKQLFQGSKEQKSAAGLKPEVAEKMRKDLDQFELKPGEIQLGEMRQGFIKTFSVGYKNSGTVPALIRIKNMPPAVSVNGLVAGADPGNSGTLLFTLDTTYLDGKISDKIVLLLSNEGAQKSQEIPVEGYVKAPLTFAPPRLVLGSDSRCEVTVKNQTQQEIKLYVSDLPDFLTIEWPGDKTIAPGASLTVAVLLDRNKVPPNWQGSNIALEFEKPVDGWKSSQLLVLPEKSR